MMKKLLVLKLMFCFQQLPAGVIGNMSDMISNISLVSWKLLKVLSAGDVRKQEIEEHKNDKDNCK